MIGTWSHMLNEQETLSELRRLINAQSRALQGRLSDVVLVQCTLRAERIKQLFEAVRHESSQPALASTKPSIPHQTENR